MAPTVGYSGPASSVPCCLGHSLGEAAGVLTGASDVGFCLEEGVIVALEITMGMKSLVLQRAYRWGLRFVVVLDGTVTGKKNMRFCCVSLLLLPFAFSW